MLTFFLYFSMTIFIIVCLFMVLLVLIQKGRGGGLASAFGGAGGNTAFGSKTGDVLTWATSVVFGIFLVLAITLNLLANYYHNQRMGPPPVTIVNTPGSPGGNVPTSTPPTTSPTSPNP
ncbi:MAG TPA: preprotein translocase subunit SecG [Tepidisphaeraceae bacterium]|jgi:preprotein translocase subunit SecG|nr:preprotein translocase subunit SecG [Tepidisphaeraceae bacterium]HEV8607406.1 preprotein translocase subunit SecG [Tepidisphaeraceae bacterium]